MASRRLPQHAEIASDDIDRRPAPWDGVDRSLGLSDGQGDVYTRVGAFAVRGRFFRAALFVEQAGQHAVQVGGIGLGGQPPAHRSLGGVVAPLGAEGACVLKVLSHHPRATG